MKQCTKCHQMKDSYTKWSKNWCKDCRNAYSRQYMKITHRFNARRAHLKSTFGLTIEQWDKILIEQNGRCKLCQKITIELCVDHDHITKQIRGLLCRKCNSAIGLLQDNPYIVYRAYKHLEYKLSTSVDQAEKLENICRPLEKSKE